MTSFPVDFGSTVRRHVTCALGDARRHTVVPKPRGNEAPKRLGVSGSALRVLRVRQVNPESNPGPGRRTPTATFWPESRRSRQKGRRGPSGCTPTLESTAISKPAVVLVFGVHIFHSNVERACTVMWYRKEDQPEAVSTVGCPIAARSRPWRRNQPYQAPLRCVRAGRAGLLFGHPASVPSPGWHGL